MYQWFENIAKLSIRTKKFITTQKVLNLKRVILEGEILAMNMYLSL